MTAMPCSVTFSMRHAFLWVRVCVVSYLVSQVSSPVRGPHFSDHPLLGRRCDVTRHSRN